MKTFSASQGLCEGTPLTKASSADLWCFFFIRLNKRLNKQWSYWWFGTPCGSCDVTVIKDVHCKPRFWGTVYHPSWLYIVSCILSPLSWSTFPCPYITLLVCPSASWSHGFTHWPYYCPHCQSVDAHLNTVLSATWDIFFVSATSGSWLHKGNLQLILHSNSIVTCNFYHMIFLMYLRKVFSTYIFPNLVQPKTDKCTKCATIALGIICPLKSRLWGIDTCLILFISSSTFGIISVERIAVIDVVVFFIKISLYCICVCFMCMFHYYLIVVSLHFIAGKFQFSKINWTYFEKPKEFS